MGGRRARRSNRGQDLRYNLEITLEEAFKGRSAEIKVPTLVGCEACNGSGAEPGHSAETCPTCSGHGKVRATQGFFTIERTCTHCRGTGKVIRHPCKACRGAGTGAEGAHAHRRCAARASRKAPASAFRAKARPA